MKLSLNRSIALAISLLLISSTFVLSPAPIKAAISSMSITGTGITNNSSLISTTITPTVSFTTGTALNVDAQTIQITLNGVTVSGGGLAVGDLTLTGCSSSNTLEASPGTNNNGSHEVTITNGTTSSNNPVILITLDTSTGSVSCPAGAYTLAIAASEVSSRSTAANYSINIVTSLESGAFFYYVGDENDVQVTAVVDATLSFSIRNSTDTSELSNVDGATVGPNLCALGNLSTAGVQSCEYRLKVSTNAGSGYSVNIATDGNLRASGGSSITNVTENSTVTGGTEGYGIALAAGNSDTNGTTAGGGNTACTEAGDFNDDDTPIGTGTNTTLYSCSTPNNPDSIDTTATALVTHRAEVDASTAAGTYNQLVTYTVTASF